jgi:energy-converting hydrogenase B subunit Q
MANHAISVTVEDRPGMLFKTTQVLTENAADIRYVDILHRPTQTEIFFECELPNAVEPVIERLRSVEGVRRVSSTPSMSQIYGKRIIIIGGGAQVGQVALGAIAEADRHNIRGERISVDTIPLVGEQELAAAAVRAVVRLPRVRLLVLAGSLMGGDIATAIEGFAHKGLS